MFGDFYMQIVLPLCETGGKVLLVRNLHSPKIFLNKLEMQNDYGRQI